uniref:DUF5915 domain-containing protein n=1 Tax=Prevotella sp. TaxID=59823 RepID=UPI004029D8B5
NLIQNMRKDAGLEITDRIAIQVSPNDSIAKAIANYEDYVKTQVLADSISVEDNAGTDVEFDDFVVRIQVTKI